jgi:hypothetical protein
MDIENAVMTLKDAWKTILKHPKKCFNWFGINIGVGLLSFWLVLVLHYFSQQIPNPNDKIIKGDLIIFITTLCATSMSVFVEMKYNHFKDLKQTLIWVLIVFITITGALGAFVSAPTEVQVQAFGIDQNKVYWASFPIAFFGVLISFLLYVMRLTVETHSYADELQETVDTETNQAKTQTTTSDGKKV